MDSSTDSSDSSDNTSIEIGFDGTSPSSSDSYSHVNARSLLNISILIAGAMLPLAFAPFNIWPLAILSPAYLLWIWTHPKWTKDSGLHFKRFNTHYKRNSKGSWVKRFKFFSFLNFNTEAGQNFVSGFIYGLGMFGVGVSWVFISIHHFGNTDAPLAVFLTAIMVSLLALLTGLQGYLLKKCFKGSQTAFCFLGFPCIWVLFEWFRSIYFTGFPWLFLGYTQFDTPLSSYAPLGSVYAVSLAVVLSSAAIVVLLLKEIRNLNKIVILSLMIGIWGIGAYLRDYQWTEIFPSEYKVSLVQGNVLPFDKFSQSDPIQAARNTYVALSEKHWGSHLIIWPENAIAYPLPMAQHFINELHNIAKANKSTLITGLQTVKHNRDYYNSMIAVGEGSGIYHKQHLVPFGDFLPFEETLRGLIQFFDIPMSSFVAGPPEQDLLKLGTVNGAMNIAPLICYEVAFPQLVRDISQRSAVIVTISEDGWFGDSFGPHQHLEIARMRALETGRFLLRATTSGISAIIGPKGKLLETSPQFQPMVLTGTFKTVTGKTPWMEIGIIPLLILLVLGILLPGRMPFKYK
jgi:apolipoprotein N-acyltransferase